MGKFNNKIEAEFNPPRKWVLSRMLTYTNQDINAEALKCVGVEITGSKMFKIIVGEGFETDLASVPRICWAFIAPWDVARAAIIHDLLYKRIRQYRAEKKKKLGNWEDPKVIRGAKRASGHERCRTVYCWVEDCCSILFSKNVWKMVYHSKR